MLVVETLPSLRRTATCCLLSGMSIKQPESVHTLGCKLFQRSVLGPKSHIVNIFSFSVEVCTDQPVGLHCEGSWHRGWDSKKGIRSYNTGLAISEPYHMSRSIWYMINLCSILFSSDIGPRQLNHYSSNTFLSSVSVFYLFSTSLRWMSLSYRGTIQYFNLFLYLFSSQFFLFYLFICLLSVLMMLTFYTNYKHPTPKINKCQNFGSRLTNSIFLIPHNICPLGVPVF